MSTQRRLEATEAGKILTPIGPDHYCTTLLLIINCHSPFRSTLIFLLFLLLLLWLNIQKKKSKDSRAFSSTWKWLVTWQKYDYIFNYLCHCHAEKYSVLSLSLFCFFVAWQWHQKQKMKRKISIYWVIHYLDFFILLLIKLLCFQAHGISIRIYVYMYS
jgi:hypothetical protein